MNNLKHTKGQWGFKEIPNPYAKGQFKYEVVNEETGGLIASVGDGETSETRELDMDKMYATEKANAKLISSAPQLLEALMIIINDDPTFLEIPQVENAIKKATE